MYLWRIDVDILYDFSIGFWKCLDSVLFFGFLILLETRASGINDNVDHVSL